MRKENLSWMQSIRWLKFNKLMAVFHGSVLLSVMNFAWHFQSSFGSTRGCCSWVDPQTTLTTLWRYSWSKTGQTHMKKWHQFVFYNNKLVNVCSQFWTHQLNYKFMCLSIYWEWKFTNEHVESVGYYKRSVKLPFLISSAFSPDIVWTWNQLKAFLLKGIYHFLGWFSFLKGSS